MNILASSKYLVDKLSCGDGGLVTVEIPSFQAYLRKCPPLVR